jgi:hypothetical protein
MQMFALALYQQLDPDFALGQALNRMLKLAGISRRPAIRSQVDLSVTTDRTVTLPSGYTVEDTLGQKWVTTAAHTLSAGTTSVTFYAEVFGAIEAVAGTITTPVTIVIGVTGVTNALDATTGQDEETDEEVRDRRNLSLQAPRTSSVGALYTALGDINGVLDLKVYENDTDTTDPILSLAAHSIWCVIDGGSVDAIGRVLAMTKNAGTGIKGSVDADYEETITLPDGSTFIYTHEMKFDRPTDEDVYIQLTVTRKVTGDPVDLDLIKEKLVARTFGIGDSLQANDLYSAVYDAGDNFVATDLEVSLDDIVYTDGGISPAADGRLVIDATLIDITEIV